MMSSLRHGKIISEVEVTHVSSNGIWLLVREKELFLPYEEFPWFKQQTITSIMDVEEQSKDHLYWPQMDVDLTVDMIEHPEKYPLKACHL